MRIICLVLCVAMMLGVMTGCSVEPSGGPGATGESSPEVSVEVSKENTSENTPETIQPTEEETPEEEKEPTTEFYDFMTLDPEPEWDLSSTQEYETIARELFKQQQEYKKTKSLSFTKKEIYYFIIKNIDVVGKEITITLKDGEKDFYYEKTAKKLETIGWKFTGLSKTYNILFWRYDQEFGNLEAKEKVEQVKKGLKIILEDYNVAYINIYMQNIQISN